MVLDLLVVLVSFAILHNASELISSELYQLQKCVLKA